MEAGEVWRILLRWAHLLAAVAWVGGSLFFWLVWRPAVRRSAARGAQSGEPQSNLSQAHRTLAAAIHGEFREVVWVAVAVLVLTGAVLTFDRLSGPGASPLYAMVLALKITAGLTMAWLAGLLRPPRQRGQPPPTRPRHAPELVLALGCLTLLLAIILRVLYQTGAG